MKEIVNTTLNAYISISTVSVRPKKSSICVSVTLSCNFSLILLRYKVIFLAGLLAEKKIKLTLSLKPLPCPLRYVSLNFYSRFVNYPVSHIQY